MRKAFFCLLLALTFSHLAGQSTGLGNPNSGQENPRQSWADSVFRTLSLDQKIGQLIFARANKDNYFEPRMQEWISKYGIGGLVFFKGSPVKQARATNEWQQLSPVPLFVAIDAERGLAMRLDSTAGFPYAMTLGAVHDDSLVFRMAKEIGRGCRRMGIHINFAPVVDINNNPRNPVINSRSFGENRERVYKKSRMYIEGLRDQQILYTAKHFPGHGDTDTDSHLTLPVLRHAVSLFDSVDLYPFRRLIQQDLLEGIMSAHIFIPAFDSGINAASSLSPLILNDLLKKKMGFSGLLVTDALEMGGVTKFYKAGEIEVKALMAGNDIVLMPQDIDLAFRSIRQAVDSCLIWPEEIDEKCLKVLKYKEKYIQIPVEPIHLQELTKDLNPESNQVLHRDILRQAFTLLKNERGLLPLRQLDTLRIATVGLNASSLTGFQSMARRYAPMEHFHHPANASLAYTDSLLSILGTYNMVLVHWVNTSIYAERDFGLSAPSLLFLRRLLLQNNVVLVHFGNPYALGRMEGLENAQAIVAAYQDNPPAYDLAAQSLFGAFSLTGSLPVSVSREYPEGSGLQSGSLPVLQFTVPAELGMQASDLASIDSLVMEGIRQQAYPGCQVLCAYDGKVFYDKTFGNLSYEVPEPVRSEHLYDLASLTKIMATTLAIMKLQEEGRLDLDDRLSHHLRYLKHTNKRHLIIRDVMAHRAGLKPWIAFYERWTRDGVPDSTVFRTSADSVYRIPVCEGLYMHQDYLDSIREAIIDSPFDKKHQYKYSDLGFILLKDLAEEVSGQSFDHYLSETFYKPLGLSTMQFNPYLGISKQLVAPTENDTVFRCKLIQAYVHDPAAAMLGGVAGHAGLFSNATDLAIILQMLLDGGNYAGKQYLSKETIASFTSVQFPEDGNRRGLGFDKPPLKPLKDGPVCLSASPASFGHSGFTGTYAWADPGNRLIYIFLSNRVHPTADNSKLSEMNIRTRVQEMFYQVIKRTRQ